MRNDEPGRPSTGRPAALLAVRIGRADVGRRVTLRHRYDATTLTDVVGRLDAWDDGVLRVERRDGRLVEVQGGRVTRVKADGAKETVATTGGGPNGAAFGPDGKLYVCNSGGLSAAAPEFRQQGLHAVGPQMQGHLQSHSHRTHHLVHIVVNAGRAILCVQCR